MLRFEHSNYLLGLCLLALFLVVFISVIAWKKKTVKKIGEPSLVRELFSGYSPRFFNLKFILLFTAFLFGVIGLANLQMGTKMEKITRKGVDVMIALDVSNSMRATDVQPSRLDKAKQLVSRMLDNMTNNRVGLVVFAGNAYLQMPLTIDYGAARMYLNTASPDLVPTQGTEFGKAMDMCMDGFNKHERKHKAIILISDGEDHDEAAIEAAKKAYGDGVMISTVGIGSRQGAPIKDPSTGDYKKDDQGNIVITKLNETELKDIAAAGHGIYSYLNDPDKVADRLVSKLDDMQKKEYAENLYEDYNSYFQYFLGVALLLILIEFFIPETKSWAWK